MEYPELSNYLHVYGPGAWHDDSNLIGDREALTKLRDAINVALEKGQSTMLSFTTDGEGYNLNICLMEQKNLDKMALPYIEEIASDHKENVVHPWQVRRIYDLNFEGMSPEEEAKRRQDSAEHMAKNGAQLYDL